MKQNTFSPEIGHAEIQSRILSSIKSDRLPHAFLFYGSEGTGKEAFAIELAQLLNCEKGPLFLCRKCPACIKISKLEHPDVRFIFPTPSQSNIKPEDIGEAVRQKAENPYRRVSFQGKNTFISIDTIRDLKKEAKFKLYEGRKKVFIISEAEEMRPEAANALLKILEEPPDNLMLILITSQIHRILPTIRSRCQLVRFPPLEGDLIIRIIKNHETNQPENLARIVRLSQENIKLAFDFIHEDVLEQREQAIELLRKIVLLEKTHELMNEIGNITRTRDRRIMSLLLFLMLTWFRDAILLQSSSTEPEYIANADLADNLKRFVEGYPNANYPAIVQHIREAIDELNDPRNLNPTLIFTNLAIILNKLIKKGFL